MGESLTLPVAAFRRDGAAAIHSLADKWVRVAPPSRRRNAVTGSCNASAGVCRAKNVKNLWSELDQARHSPAWRSATV
jgi:hypothetical protein